MQKKLLKTLCGSLGLHLLAEDRDGTLHSRGDGTTGGASDLPGALFELVDRSCDLDLLQQLVRAARAGRGAEHLTELGFRVLLEPEAEGGVSAVVVPPGARPDATLRRRADSADLAAGVSHELANALGAIAGWAQLARRGQRVDEALALIESSADHAWTAAKQMLQGVGQDAEAPAVDEDFSAIVDEVSRLLLPKAARSHVRMRTSIAPQLHVRALRGELWTIVWNLAANAVEAMPGGGTLGIELAADGECIRLRVEDDGAGMDAHLQAQVFDSYFTTKKTGTGLGLPMVKRAVEQLGGTLSLQSQPGLGSRFQVELPRVQATARRRRRRVSSGKRSSGVFLTEHLAGRVLVVDDDRPLREMVATAVGMRGATVVSAASGAEALEQNPPFELAIIDLVLPDMNGDELLAALRRRGMVKAAILATGMEPPEHFALGGEPDTVLRKPYELEDLFERICQVLAETSERSATS